MKHIRLALDLSTTRTGWAIEETESGRIRTGVVCLRRGLTKERARDTQFRLMDRLRKLERVFVVDDLTYEFVHARNASADQLLIRLCSTVEHWCRDYLERNPAFVWRGVRVTAWKKACVGRGNASKRDYHRAAIVRWPNENIWCDDVAAARFLLDYSNVTE